MLPFRKLNVYSNQTCLSYVGSVLLLLFNIDVICVIKCVANPSPVAIINKTMTCGLFYSFRFMWFWESGECVFALLCFFFCSVFLLFMSILSISAVPFDVPHRIARTRTRTLTQTTKLNAKKCGAISY